MENYFNSINLVRLIVKYKFHFLILGLLSIVLSAIFSSPRFITPKYKSYTIVYPANLSTLSEESTTEQMLQWLEAKDIKDSIIKKFSLDKHYEINKSSNLYYFQLMKEYDANIQVGQTKYESVIITVFDKNPKIACDIVNSILYFYNKKVREIHRSRALEQHLSNIYMKDLLTEKIDSLGKVLTNYKEKYSIYDIDNQSKEVTKGFLRTIDGDNRNINTNEVLKLKDNLEKKGSEYSIENKNFSTLLDANSLNSMQVINSTKSISAKYSYYNMVSEPYPAEKKSSPVRWIIVLTALLSSLFAVVLFAIFVENYNSFKNYFLKNDK